MWIKNLAAILSLTITGEAFGTSCMQPVYHLNQGDAAVCEGYLFSPDEEARLRLEDQDYKLLKDMDALKDTQLGLYKAEVTDYQAAITQEKAETVLWRTAADTAEQKYIATEERAGYRDIAFTLLGVLLTVGAGYSIGMAAHKTAGVIHK